MSNLFLRANSAATYISGRSPLRPALGLVLGSGMGSFASHVHAPTLIPYAEIPYFPRSTVIGHSGNLVLGQVSGIPIAVMQGRVHAYEGYSPAQVTFPTRVLGLLGCSSLILTNAAGAINPSYRRGEIVLLADHINLTGSNACVGPNDSRFAATPGSARRFFDMSRAYSPPLRSIAVCEAARQGIELVEGVYIGVLGPSFETPAEIRAFRTLGADLVGMSTVHEVTVARHMGLDVLGLSLVTNFAAGLASEATGSTPKIIEHEEVLETSREAENRLAQLLTAIIPRIASCK